MESNVRSLPKRAARIASRDPDCDRSRVHATNGWHYDPSRPSAIRPRLCHYQRHTRLRVSTFRCQTEGLRTIVLRARSRDRQRRSRTGNIAHVALTRQKREMEGAYDCACLGEDPRARRDEPWSQCFWPQQTPTTAVVRTGEKPSFWARSTICVGLYRSTSASATTRDGRRARTADFVGPVIREIFLSRNS